MTIQPIAKEFTEEQIRLMRDNVYGRPITNGEWDNCKITGSGLIQ